ncbi:MAG: hypothetical protein JXA81_01650 [Sedimentisphaerales bacterium]|nr:hypothetical protein [Sedimentisphaerales bacterium]
MKRLILTIILGILIISLTGCIGYRRHHPWHSRQVVIATSPKHPPLPPAPPRHPDRHLAPPTMPRHRY